MFYSLGHGVLVPLSRLLYRPTIEGKDNVPLDGGVILASNHLSFIDSFAIPLVSPRKVRFLAKEEYWTGDGVKGLLQKGSSPPSAWSPSTGTHRRLLESLDKGLEVLKAGDAFGIYRRTRSRDGRLYRGRTGVAWLALNAQVPVVPVGLIGTQDIQPVGASFRGQGDRSLRHADRCGGVSGTARRPRPAASDRRRHGRHRGPHRAGARNGYNDVPSGGNED